MNMVASHWSANAAALVAYAVIAAVHLLGVRGAVTAARKAGEKRPASRAREAVFFQAGLLVAAGALVSPLAYWAHVYIWAHSVQDLLLGLIVPGMVVLGAPWQPLAAGIAVLRRRPVPTGAAVPAPASRLRPARGWLTVPAGITAGWLVVWCGWHVPAAYDAVARYPLLQAAEVISYLGGGTVLWRQFIGSWPYTPAFAPLYRVMLVAATMAVSSVMGMTLAFGSAVVYPAYRTPLHQHPYSVIVDQQAGGGVLWLLALPPLLVAGVALLIRWLSDEEAEALDSGLDRLTTGPRSVWPSRPGLR